MDCSICPSNWTRILFVYYQTTLVLHQQMFLIVVVTSHPTVPKDIFGETCVCSVWAGTWYTILCPPGEVSSTLLELIHWAVLEGERPWFTLLTKTACFPCAVITTCGCVFVNNIRGDWPWINTGCCSCIKTTGYCPDTEFTVAAGIATCTPLIAVAGNWVVSFKVFKLPTPLSCREVNFVALPVHWWAGFELAPN